MLPFHLPPHDGRDHQLHTEGSLSSSPQTTEPRSCVRIMLHQMIGGYACKRKKVQNVSLNCFCIDAITAGGIVYAVPFSCFFCYKEIGGFDHPFLFQFPCR